MDITKSVQNVILDIHEYSESQADVWQKLPWLANQANMRTGWNEGFTLMLKGYLKISNNVVVDLENGKLYNVCNFARRADDAAVLSLVWSLDSLNANHWFKVLTEHSKSPYAPCYSRKEIIHIENTRSANIQKWELNPDFYRRPDHAKITRLEY